MAIGFNNPLQQRLIAAGAQPERAKQFVENSMASKGIVMPQVGKKQGPDEIYNDKYASTSEALLQGNNVKVFRAPKFKDPLFQQYYDYVFGKNSYKTIADKSGYTFKSAPNYLSAKTSQSPFYIDIVKGIEGGQNTDFLIEKLTTAYQADPSILPSGVTLENATNKIKLISKEYAKGKDESSLAAAFKSNIAKDINFKFNMPDPKLVYGTATNISAGQVDVLNNPKANELYQKYAQNPNASPAQLNQYKAALAKELSRRKMTPWSDEAKRRESLKGQKLK